MVVVVVVVVVAVVVVVVVVVVWCNGSSGSCSTQRRAGATGNETPFLPFYGFGRGHFNVPVLCFV